MVFLVTDLNPLKTPLGCGRTGDSQHETTPEKSAGILVKSIQQGCFENKARPVPIILIVFGIKSSVSIYILLNYSQPDGVADSPLSKALDLLHSRKNRSNGQQYIWANRFLAC